MDIFEKLSAEIVGWTVLRIESSPDPEAIFILVLEKEGKKKSITIHATDLGWWIGKIQKAK